MSDPDRAIAFATMVVLDAAMMQAMMLLNSAAVAPPRAGVQAQMNAVAMPEQMQAAQMHARMQALLMSPTPILAQLARHQVRPYTSGAIENPQTPHLRP